MTTSSSSAMALPRIVVPKRFADARGWFCESYHRGRLHALGIGCDFVQDNLSISLRAGTLRGLHFQLPPAAQAKLVSVVRGRIFDVAVDIRRGSPTYGKYVATELSDRNGRQLFVPIGFAHAFVTLEDDTLVLYKVSHHYAPDLDRGIRWDDPDIAIAWPIKSDDVIVSDRDRRLPLLREFSSPFPFNGCSLVPLPDMQL